MNDSTNINRLGNEPAFPIAEDTSVAANTRVRYGLTKREWMATEILKGLLSNPTVHDHDRVEKVAMFHTEALLVEFDAADRRRGAERVMAMEETDADVMAAWRTEVANGDTRLGLDEWHEHQREAEAHERAQVRESPRGPR